MKANNKLTMQDVLEEFYEEYKEKYQPNERQAKAAYHIINCKTGAFGANISFCGECGHMMYHNNSCRDRCCPMCEGISNEMWIDAQNEHVLDIDYFHIVITCPSELYPLLYSNQRELYGLFFSAAAESVMELSMDNAHLGGKPGFISIMHTWSADLCYHPHLHLLIMGGGLDERRCWHPCRDSFFIPGKVLARLFRGKYMAGVKKIYKAGKLNFTGQSKKYRNRYEFKELLDTCYSKEWVTDIRESYAGADAVMHYLGRYTHRIAISNSRIIRMDNGTVTFKAKDYRNGGVWKEITLEGAEFVRRFMMHVPPKSFVRIRHYGLLSSRNKNKIIPICRNLIGCRKFLSRLKGLDKPAVIKKLYGKDITVCPCCGSFMSFGSYRQIVPDFTPP